MKEMKRVLSFVLCLVMLVSLLPGTALEAFAATGDPVIVVAGSDYQAGDSGTTMQNIMNKIKEDYSSVYGILMGGDYDAGDVTPKASHLTAVDNTISAVYPGIAEENRIMIQGNHETYGNLSPSSNSLLDATGAHDTDYYGVYAINYEDFDSAASGLKSYLDGRSGNQPIFVMSHQPLHDSPRGDNNAAVNLFNVLNKYDDLDIIFLFGHNHSRGYDAYLGNGSIYLKKGDSITVAGGSTETLNFTYMNYGYVGYVGNNYGSADETLTMTAFEIYEDEVYVKRYDASGLHNLKAAGATVSGYNTDSNVYGTAVINLSDGTSTTSPLSTDSGDSNTGSGTTNGGSGWTYELVTSIEAGEKYVIVGNDNPVALMDDDGSFGSQTVTISGTTLTSTVALTEWTISGTSGGTIVSDQGNGLSYSNSSFNLTGAADNTFNITAVNDNFTILTVRTNSSYSKYYFNYDGSGWTSKPTTAAYVRLYKLTGTGTGGGSTVTPEGGDWVTISSGVGGTIYTLTDTLEAGKEYLIVSANSGSGYALQNPGVSSGSVSMGATAVDIQSGTTAYITTDATDIVWTATDNGSVMKLINNNNYLEGKSGGVKIYSASQYSDRGWEYESNQLKYTGGNNTYTVYYDGGFTYTYGSTSNKVYLFSKTGTESAGDAEYAKLDGELTYTVSRGASAEDALADVMGGIDVVVSSDKSAETALDDDNTDITWTLADGYDGSVPGEYAVTISYKGVKLGTAKVIVPEATIVGYELVSYEGTVSKGASKSAETGTHIRVDVKDDEGEDYYVPVTLAMLTDANGNAPSTREIADLTGLTVSYNGQTFENFTLHVVAKAGNNYPEYPDEGHVKVSKTGTGIQFQSTGVAQVEVSAFGIPMNQGVDVVIILDTSSSMRRDTFEASDGSQKTRIEILRPAVDELLQQLKTKRPDGSNPDIDIAIATFNANTMATGSNYISDDGGDPAYSQTADYGLLTGTTLSNAWVDIMSLDDNWGTLNNGANIPCTGSGTNYDYGLQMAYDLLAQKQADSSSEREQFVVFMSDGAPYQFNGVYSNGGESDWIDWVLANYDETDAATNNDIPDTVTEKNKTFYTGYAGDGQTHRVANAIKGSPDENFDIVTFDTDSSGALKSVPGLGATMYSIGLLLADESNNITAENQAAVLEKIASSEDKYFNITLASELDDAFTKFGNDVLMAAYDARYVDQMGDDYDLQLKPVTDLDGNKVADSKIEILSYEVYTKAEADASAAITEEMIGKRKDTAPTVLETITFKADGTEAYSDKDSTGPNGETINAGSNILIDGVIYAKNFWYNTTEKEVEIAGVDIPTGKDSANLTTGSSNMLPAETFYWKLGTLTNTELAMRYYVYLTGTKEGTRKAGSYPTNEYATLYYDNYLENPCYKETVSPVLAWEAANVSYAFYLVDENGNIIVNQTTGETGSFANKIAVTNPVVYEEVLLNNTDTVESIKVASSGVLPDGYELYDPAAVYTIEIKSDATGSWTIAQGDGTVASTYVTQYDPANAAAYTNDLTKNSNADFTHTVVWFAVLWKVQALPDVVVIDYGLPVDISVLRNDMFGEAGKLAGIGAYSESLNLDGHDTTLASGFVTEYEGTYGTAKADTATGEVRYTPANMQMNGYDKFAYAVNYTGATNPGYYYDTITVIPATTIYYEDSFLTYTASNTEWKDEGTAVEGATQAEDRPGQYSLTDANNIYGYDGVNLGMSTFSLGTAKKVHVGLLDEEGNASYATAEFTFYGTGYDIISMTSNTTGLLAVKLTAAEDIVVNGQIVHKKDEIVKRTVVDTYYGYTYTNDEWVATPNVDKAMYQVPVIQAEGLPYGKYTVTLTATYTSVMDDTTAPGYDLYIDAVRIYDPANDGASDGTEDTTIEDAYVADHEGWPSYIELRNNLIAAEDIFGNNDTSTVITGMVFIDGDPKVDNAQIEDYKSYGPNNEVYLAAGQQVAFKLAAPTNIDRIHLGIKSADGNAATYTIQNIDANGNPYGAKTATINTTTDMYYDITGYKNDIIVISNTGSSGILSITNIKSTYTSKPTTETQEVQAQSVEDERFETYIYMTADAAAAVMKAMEPKPVNPFADIQAGQFFYESVLWAVKNGITNGVDASHFGPYINCNRAQVVTFLWRAAGSPAPENRVNPFTDVPENSWYTDAVLWAVENGITNGLTATTFGPTALCNRAQVVTFLWRANGSKVPEGAANPFADVAEGAFYHNAVVWAVKNGITTGATATTFNPTGICMRAHVVTFLYRAEQLADREVNGVS